MEEPDAQPTSLLNFMDTHCGRLVKEKQLVEYGGYMFEKNGGAAKGKTTYYTCRLRRQRGCKGRIILYLENDTFRASQVHSHPPDPDRAVREAALERLRVFTLQAGEGNKAIDIVRKWMKELPPETRAVMPDEDKLTDRVRRWARVGGIELTRATFEDYLVDDGVAAVPASSSRQLSSNSDQFSSAAEIVKKEPPDPSLSSGEPLEKPELIFLQSRKSGERHRVMIEDKVYLFVKHLGQGGSLYRCEESRIGCPVTVKIIRQEKQYEIRGTHVHDKPIPTQTGTRRKRCPDGLVLVDEEGRPLGNVDIDNIATAGEEFTLDYGSLRRIDSVPPFIPPPPATSQEDPGDDEMCTDANDCFDDCEDGEDDGHLALDFDAGSNEEIETISPKKFTKSETVVTSSTPGKSRKDLRKNAAKSGEKCYVCGDALLVSETLSSSEETFRKACCYLNVKFENEWFPRKSNGQFYSFCESCTNEVTRIQQLYKKVEVIQSLIFKKVEHVEKRIADAEIVDNWMADAPLTSAIRFEGFRKQVLVNYRNKLRLRREIRVGAKMGNRFTEIQPTSTVQMFASDPADTDAFRRRVPTGVCSTKNAGPQSSQAPTAKMKRGRPKSMEAVESPAAKRHPVSLAENIFDNTNDVDRDENEIIGFDEDDTHYDTISVTSGKETKFWEEDPSRLQVDNNNDDCEDNYDDARSNDNEDGPDNPDESDLDYDVTSDENDEDWGSSKSKQGKPRKRKGRPSKKTESANVKSNTWTKLIAESSNCGNDQQLNKRQGNAKSKASPDRPKRKWQKKDKAEFPDAILTKDGRVFLCGFEILKNPPGVYKRRPNSESFTCVACGRVIQSFWRMKLHICGIHLGKYKCGTCGKQYGDPGALRRHIKNLHSERAATRVPCPICGRPISGGDPRLMLYHRWSHLGEEEKKDPQYKRYCPSSKKDPNRIKANYGLQTFMCSYCPKEFYQTEALRRHEAVHKGEGPTFQCQFCGKMYDNRKTLWGHSSVCEKKSQGVTQPDSLASYPCPKCPARFTKSGSRSKHIRTKHPRTSDALLPFSCPKCPRSFSTRSGFKAHKRICVEGQTSSASGRKRSSNKRNLDRDSPQPSTSSHGNQQGLLHPMDSQTGEPYSIPSLFGGNQTAPRNNSSSSTANSPNTSASGPFTGGFGYNAFGSYPGGNVYHNQ